MKIYNIYEQHRKAPYFNIWLIKLGVAKAVLQTAFSESSLFIWAINLTVETQKKHVVKIQIFEQLEVVAPLIADHSWMFNTLVNHT